MHEKKNHRKYPRADNRIEIAYVKKRIKKTANEIEVRRNKIEDTLKGIEKQEKALRKISERIKTTRSN